MTPLDIAAKATELRNDLVALSHEQIGMSNYKSVMRKYQVLLNELIVLVRELAETVDKASTPQPSVSINVDAPLARRD